MTADEIRKQIADRERWLDNDADLDESAMRATAYSREAQRSWRNTTIREIAELKAALSQAGEG